MGSVLNDISDERERQILKGFDAAHDDGWGDGSLLHAALLAVCNVAGHRLDGCDPPSIDGPWPDQFVMHLAEKYKGNNRQKLIIAAALIVAEVERLDREVAEIDCRDIPQ